MSLGPERPEPRVRLDALMEPVRWQRLQDHFSAVLGLGLRTFTAEHALFVPPSWPMGADPDRLVQALSLGSELDELWSAAARAAEPMTVAHPSGVSFAAIPLRAGSREVGHLVVGPVVLGRRETPEEFRARAASAGLSAGSVWPALLTLKVYTFAGFRSALQLVEDVAGIWLDLAEQSRALHALVASAPATDPAAVRAYTSRLAQSLLEVATAVTNAEGGSVMLYEPAEDVFRIAAAEGLAVPIVTNTRVKRQDSLAGLAVDTREVLLVDDTVRDDRMRRRMHRNELASSMIAPLLSESSAHPVGVLSVRTSHAADRFTAEDADLLKKLARLAHTALSGVSVAAPGRPA